MMKYAWSIEYSFLFFLEVFQSRLIFQLIEQWATRGCHYIILYSMVLGQNSKSTKNYINFHKQALLFLEPTSSNKGALWWETPSSLLFFLYLGDFYTFLFYLNYIFYYILIIGILDTNRMCWQEFCERVHDFKKKSIYCIFTEFYF